MFRSNFDKNLENATSHLHLEPDWPTILLLCDEINQKDITPKNAFTAIKKKMSSQNPHSSYFTLLVLESVIKNCGTPMHEEVFTKENCEMFSNFIEQTAHENVRRKMLDLIQTWANAFRSTDKYQSIKDTMNILKAKGNEFPPLEEADAMFASNTAPNWVDGKVCHRCRVEFSFTTRKHHCRNCGQVFCGQCTSRQCPIPGLGMEKDVRVCDGCYSTLQRPTSKSSTRSAESDLPAEYLNSSLAQQVQTPQRKSDQELKEEEELQLALALSQSEAEEKKKVQQHQALSAASYRMEQRTPTPEAPPVPKEYHQEEMNPDLAKYMNRSYWEQLKNNDSPMASPSAPSPMPATPQPMQQLNLLPQKTSDEVQIDEFAANMRTQVEIFVNRMKSNSSRGRSIANDSSVQTLFLTLTSLHSQQLSYIKEMDDKRMWYEQLQDKLAQIKDSRAALDVLRQEHLEKLRLQAEEQERQRQTQMAQKLEIMRKKKQEYLQYQRQLALQKIQEQEREMQLRQEQQKAQYLMGQTAFPFNSGVPGVAGVPGIPRVAGITNMPSHGSPSHQMAGNMFSPYATNSPGAMNNPSYATGGQPIHIPTTGSIQMPNQTPMPGMYNPNAMPNQHPGMMLPNAMAPPGMLPNHPMLATAGPPNVHQQLPVGDNDVSLQQMQQHQTQRQQQQQQQPQLTHVMLQHQNVIQNHSPIPTATQMPPSVNGVGVVGQQSMPQMPTQHQHQQQQQQPPPQQQQQLQQQQQIAATSQIQAVAAAPAPPQTEPEIPLKSEEPPTAELISFD